MTSAASAPSSPPADPNAPSPATPAAPVAPAAPRQPHDVTVHGDRRIDDWYWLRDRDDPRTLPYLRAENAYADAWFAPHAALAETLYREMYGRIQQDDDSVPYRKGRWWYSSRTAAGEQYPRLLRRAALGAERRYDPDGRDETLLDLNELARGKAFLRLGLAAVSRDGARLAYSADFTGGRDFVLRVRELASGRDSAWEVAEVSSATWSNDGRSLYYTTMDASKRSSRLWRHAFGVGVGVGAGAGAGPDAGGDASAEAEATADELLYEETDELFDIGIGKTRDERCIVLEIESKDSTEARVIDADAGSGPVALRTVLPRRADIEYHLDHRGSHYYLRINDTGRNFRLVRIDDRAPDIARAEELIAARDDVMLDDLDLFAGHMVVTERERGSLALRIVDLAVAGRGGEHRVAFDEAAYSVHTAENAEFETTTLRFVFGSLTTPASTYDYDLVSRERVLRKRQPVPGYDPSLYASERVVARAGDGTEVPISLVRRRDREATGPQPLLLYGYGSYGIPIDPTFAQTRVSLLDRGVVFAIAHIRGGGDLGKRWYEAAKMATKAVTFTDFIACAEALIARGTTAPSLLAIQGASAGGLLMGAVVNQRPELFRAVLSEVPFVDVVSTMLDETLPLTTGEFIEWGNPKIAEQYAWMRAYSPYDNLKPGAYPSMLVRTGLNDTQVAYWEPAKYVAKLRTLKTDANPLLFKINLEVGHGGASGRFDALREEAEDQAFVLAQLGRAGP